MEKVKKSNKYSSKTSRSRNKSGSKISQKKTSKSTSKSGKSSSKSNKSTKKSIPKINKSSKFNLSSSGSDNIESDSFARKRNITVFTDGSCLGNGKVGAAGGIGIHFPNGELEDISLEFDKGCCTNQRTELYAILYAIQYIDDNFDLNKCKVMIKTDSTYSVNSITKWAEGHSRNDWCKRTGEPIANREFIQEIFEYYQNFNIDFEWVEAHTGQTDSESIANAQADFLANSAAKRAARNKKICRPPSSGSRRNSREFYCERNSKQIYNTPYRSKSRASINGFPIDDDFEIELVKRRSDN